MVEIENIFDDSDETVGGDGHMDLDSDGILQFSTEDLGLEVLFDSFVQFSWQTYGKGYSSSRSQIWIPV